MLNLSIKAALAAALMSLSTLAAAAVNVNVADAKALDKELVGVGKTVAVRIVDERKQGLFKDMNDLKKRVKGFGDKLAVKNAENIKFKD